MGAAKFCACLLLMVAAVSRAAILDPMTVMKDDISRIKVMMEHLGETMERFNGLYLSKLETRLLTSATSLAHIDSNVKNLQERAHVWDTFQLHVAAWNEQIKSLDKKLDILNRGTEKWDMIDEKVASLQPLDYKLNKIMTKLEEMETKVGEIHRKVNAGAGQQQAGAAAAVAVQTQPVSVALPSVEAPLFSEYTGRGVLSALKDIEVKVNKLADGHKPANGNGAGSSSSSSRELQQQTLDVVNDVAGKVDIILDKVLVKNRPEGPADDVSYDDGDTDYGGNGSSIGDGSVHQTERSLIKLWRRMLQPVRRANRKFETLDRVLNQLERAANASAVQRRDDAQLLDDMSSMLECCSRNQVEMRSLSQKVELLATSVRDGQETIDQRMAAAVRAGQDSADQRCSAAVRAGQEAADQRCLASLRAGLEAVDTRCTAAIRAGQDAAEQRSATQVEQAQAQLQQTQSALVSQIGDLVKEQVGELVKEHVTAGVERIRQSLNQRKKPNAGQGSNETLLVLVEDDVVTDGGKTAAASASNATATLASGKIGLRGCHDLRLAGETESRVYSLASGKELNEGGRDYNTRFCDMTTDGGGWTVIQRRGDYGAPRENFSVGWREYKLGFGQLEREFWFGNDFIHRLTNEHDVVLRVELWDFDDGHVFADYESFRVDSEEDLYRLWVEGYQGNATDSLGSHNGYAFSTFDRDNDEAPPCCPCAPAYGGGWWFYSCFEANLNGEYHTNPTDNDYYRGIIWELWRGDYSLRRAEMKIRPHDFPRLMAVAGASTTTTTSTTLPPPPPHDAADDYAAIPEDP